MSQHRIGYDNVRANALISLEDHIPGLNGFDCRFEESDHHLAVFSVGGMTGGPDRSGRAPYLMRFDDHDSGIVGGEEGDLRSFWAYYRDMSAYADPFGLSPTPLSVEGSQSGTGTMTLSIPPVSSNEVVFLRGFSISNGRGRSNHHIKAIGVRFDTRINAWRVTFKDDSPDDDMFSAEVFYYKANRIESEETADNIAFSPIRTISATFTASGSVAKSGIQGYTFLAGF